MLGVEARDVDGAGDLDDFRDGGGVEGVCDVIFSLSGGWFGLWLSKSRS